MQKHPYSRFKALIFLLVCAYALAFATACSSNKAKAREVILDSLKDLNVRELKVDSFYTDSKYPNLAYASATVIHNFAGPSGEPQREYLGYILRRDGEGWKIQKLTAYTEDEDKARVFLGGGK